MPSDVNYEFNRLAQLTMCMNTEDLIRIISNCMSTDELEAFNDFLEEEVE